MQDPGANFAQLSRDHGRSISRVRAIWDRVLDVQPELEDRRRTAVTKTSQYCINRHDVLEVGRTSDRQCRECARQTRKAGYHRLHPDAFYRPNYNSKHRKEAHNSGPAQGTNN